MRKRNKASSSRTVFSFPWLPNAHSQVRIPHRRDFRSSRTVIPQCSLFGGETFSEPNIPRALGQKGPAERNGPFFEPHWPA